MPDDQELSAQDIKDLQEITSRLPNGHPMQKKISLLLSSQPTQFEKERAKGYRSPEDEEFAKTIGLKPTDIAGVTNAAMLGVGAGGVARTIAKKGLKAALLPVAKGLAGTTAGAATGHYLGRMVGMPEAGGVIGGLAGGVLGGFSGEKIPTPEPEPFPPEATSTGKPSMTSPTGRTVLKTPPPPPTVKPSADPFSGMTSSGRPSMTSPAGATTPPPSPEALPRRAVATKPTAVEEAAAGKANGKTSILSRGSTLYQLGEEPNPSNPVHVKIINDLQTRSGTELRAMAKNGDRFAAFILRNMPRP